MGTQYSIFKETEKNWFLKITKNGEVVLTQIFPSRIKAEKELLAYLKFTTSLRDAAERCPVTQQYT